jgi:mono/diheme cytochrome c family protein
MDDQPKIEPFESGAYRRDTVDSRRWEARRATAPAPFGAAAVATRATEEPERDQVFLTGRDGDEYAAKPPMALDEEERREFLTRGRREFEIHCSPCHDLAGAGNGMVAQRGYPFPPTYHSDRLRAMPIGYFFAVATEGRENMPAYGELIPPDDRWAIASYVRALQTSQYAPPEALNEHDETALTEMR